LNPIPLAVLATAPISLTRDSASKAEISVFESTLKKLGECTQEKSPEKQPENSGNYPRTVQQRPVNWNCVRFILQIW
jgi:hypothetical protein